MRPPRGERNELMGSLVTGVLDALVGRARVEGPKGWLGLPGAWTPGGESSGHPFGSRTDLMVGAGAGRL
jgi:hypothetical protein